MVWDELIQDQMAAYGMKAQEIYQLAVEHDPDLAVDDYVYQIGKAFYLPICYRFF